MSARAELVPDRAHYAPGQPVSIEVTPATVADAELQVTRLGDTVRRVGVPAGTTAVQLGSFDRGGYGVRLGGARTAFDVLEDPFERPRYGFIVHLTDATRIPEVLRTFRRLHLNVAQLYDWAYRHAQLLPPMPRYVDPLGQERDLAVVEAMSAGLAAAGSTPLGYSAVYAVGSDEAAEWAGSLLLRTDGAAYRLGEDFLILVDPAEPRWLEHYLGQLERVVEETSIAGFHLDQYGWPKFARRADGVSVDLAASFVELLAAVRDRLPETPVIFNNVNDFPTSSTARAPQNATYIEVWPPHTTLRDLASLATSARVLRPEHPPILSAYLSCFRGDERRAFAAAELVMATAFSHGAAHLLLGEDGAALTDPYYPDHHRLSDEILEAFVPWYDFAVRYGDLLHDPAQVDVTESFTGGINQDVVVEAGTVPVSTKADPGSLWVRVVRTAAGLVIHLIDLSAQTDADWDAEKNESPRMTGAAVSLAPVGPGAGVWFATIDQPDLVRLDAAQVIATTQSNALAAAQSAVRLELPEFRVWAVLWLPWDALG